MHNGNISPGGEYTSPQARKRISPSARTSHSKSRSRSQSPVLSTSISSVFDNVVPFLNRLRDDTYPEQEATKRMNLITSTPPSSHEFPTYEAPQRNPAPLSPDSLQRDLNELHAHARTLAGSIHHESNPAHEIEHSPQDSIGDRVYSSVIPSESRETSTPPVTSAPISTELDDAQTTPRYTSTTPASNVSPGIPLPPVPLQLRNTPPSSTTRPGIASPDKIPSSEPFLGEEHHEIPDLMQIPDVETLFAQCVAEVAAAMSKAREEDAREEDKMLEQQEQRQRVEQQALIQLQNQADALISQQGNNSPVKLQTTSPGKTQIPGKAKENPQPSSSTPTVLPQEHQVCSSQLNGEGNIPKNVEDSVSARVTVPMALQGGDQTSQVSITFSYWCDTPWYSSQMCFISCPQRYFQLFYALCFLLVPYVPVADSFGSR